MPIETDAKAMRVGNEAERIAMRSILARTQLLGGGETYTECPCGWFYVGARCPDKKCKEWKKATGGKKVVRLYSHTGRESNYDAGSKLGLEGDALRNFAYWGDEIAFDVEVDLETGSTKLLTVDGHKIEY